MERVWCACCWRHEEGRARGSGVGGVGEEGGGDGGEGEDEGRTEVRAEAGEEAGGC